MDILKVPISSRENQYNLVAQEYSSKWPFAQAIQDQKADMTVKILKDEIFSLVEEVKTKNGTLKGKSSVTCARPLV